MLKKKREEEETLNGNPLVSVLVQTYQQESFIRECLDGVLRQETNFTFEVCLGVDISNDATEAICQEYADMYPEVVKLTIRDPKDKVILFGQPIGRYNFTQNILSAKGKFVAIVEGDDYWTDAYKLRKQVDFLQTNPDVNFCCTNRRVLKEGVLCVDENLNSVLKKVDNGPFEITEENFFSEYCVSTCTCMYRRSALDIQLVRDYPTAFKDIFLFYSLVRRGRGFLLPDVTTVYRIHSGGTWSMQTSLRKVRANAWTIKKMKTSWIGDSVLFQEKFKRTMKRFLQVAIKQGSVYDIFLAIKWRML
jgi:glycosyltransferase involved in cell wall biosynthesis